MPDNTDYGVPRGRGFTAAWVQPFADRILIGPKGLGEAFVDDGHRRRSVGVACLEEATTDQGDSHGLEIVRSDNPLICFRRRIFQGHGLRVDGRRAGASLATQWQARNRSSELDAGLSLDAVE
jgi:hypothetical protein